MKKKKFNFKEEYLKSLQFIKESRKFIYIAILIFLVFIIVGAFFSAPEVLRKVILEMLQELLDKTSGLSAWGLIVFIFSNNLKSSFFGLFLGVIFGIFPVFIALVNGYILGFVASGSVVAEGPLVLLRLVPHGIFELPAALLSFGLGIKFGSFVFQRNKIKSLKNYFWNCVRVFILVIVPLLIVAAIVEGLLIFGVGQIG